MGIGMDCILRFFLNLLVKPIQRNGQQTKYVVLNESGKGSKKNVGGWLQELCGKDG